MQGICHSSPSMNNTEDDILKVRASGNGTSHISAQQARYDCKWIYAALQYTQRDIGDNKALIRNKYDGFNALLSLIHDFDKGGSLEQ